MMTMECPRCGFSQPKDRYCAKCGLDIDAYNAKPKPLLVRLAQDPNVHLSLIGILVAVIVGYIVYSQGRLVTRQVGALLRGVPLSSRDAADPNQPAPAPRQAQKTVAKEVAETVSDTTTVPAAAPEAQTPASQENRKVEISYWEVPREILSAVIPTAEKVGESSGGGRAYAWKDASKVTEMLQNASRRISLARTMPMDAGAQTTVETPATGSDAFQFGMLVQVVKPEGKDLSIKWDSSLVLPPPETPQEAASRQPVVKALTETVMSGTTTLGDKSLLMIVFEPSNRNLRDEYLAKAGDGPWTVFNSFEFKSGATDWIVLVQLKKAQE